jgi:tetratricopeptide (TPR) repeat protein
VLLALGRLAEAVIAFDSLLQLDSTNVMALCGKGDALRGSNRMIEAVGCYELALSYD